MSYITFQLKCNDCKNSWNSSFGVLGKGTVAKAPRFCPKCKSGNLIKIKDGWSKTKLTFENIQRSKV